MWAVCNMHWHVGAIAQSIVQTARIYVDPYNGPLEPWSNAYIYSHRKYQNILLNWLIVLPTIRRVGVGLMTLVCLELRNSRE